MSLARVTPHSVVAQEAVHEIPPCDAELIVTVDGEPVKSRVNLLRGFSKGRIGARICLMDEMPLPDDGIPF